MQPDKLGILAGGGLLPRRLIDAARNSGREVFVVGFHGHTDSETLAGIPHLVTRLGAAGEIIDALKGAGVKQLVMGGHIRRPGMLELRPDWRGAKIAARIGLTALGDDGLLKAIRRELEAEGFTLLGPQDVLATLLMPAGVLTTAKPSEMALSDMNRGIAVLKALAPLDVGQAVIVQQGLVLGIEAIEGTTALIGRTASLKREGEGGVLVKFSKAQQDSKLDLPTIGPDTVQQCSAAGLAGLAVEAGRALFIDQAQAIAAANKAGLFIIGVESV